MIRSSNSSKSSQVRRQYEKSYYGNYLGIVVQNNDPDKRGRIKIFVPHIAATVYAGWDSSVRDKSFKFIGKNIDSDISDIIDDLKQVLPWAECAAPLVGATGTGRYNAHLDQAIISDSNKLSETAVLGDITTGQHKPNKLNKEGIGEKPAKIYEIEEFKVADAFNKSYTEDEAGETTLGMPNNINKHSYNYTPNSYSNKAKGTFSIPNVGSHVWLFFQNGDIMSPVYFATSHGREDWNAIYESSENNHGYDYPGAYENKSLGDDPSYNHNTETYRNKFVINQKGGVVEFINTDNKEILKLTHYSGSFKEFNNDTNIEFATNNDQRLVRGDQFLTINGSRNEFTKLDYDLLVRGDFYRKIGTFNTEKFEEWKEKVNQLAQVKQLFETKRVARKPSKSLTFEDSAPIQEKIGIPVPGVFNNEGHALCPLCSHPQRAPIWNIDNLNIFNLITDRTTIGANYLRMFAGVVNATQPFKHIKPPANPKNFLGSGKCPVCNGTGYSPSSQGGNFENQGKDSLIPEHMQSLTSDLALIEKEMGLGGSEISHITKHKVETIGLVMNEFPSTRQDDVGKIVQNEVRVFKKGVATSFATSPLLEYVHVDDLPGGSYSLNVCNRYNVQTGAGGMFFKSYGPVDISGTITNISGEQVNVGSSNEINISSNRVNIVANILSLRQRNYKQVLVDSSLGVSQNLVVGGGAHIEGELSCHHITAPTEIQVTEENQVYGTLMPVKIGVVRITSGSSAGIYNVYGTGARKDCVKLNTHSHKFKNVPLNLLKSSDSVRQFGTNCNTSTKVAAAPVQHGAKGGGLLSVGESL